MGKRMRRIDEKDEGDEWVRRMREKNGSEVWLRSVVEKDGQKDGQEDEKDG